MLRTILLNPLFNALLLLYALLPGHDFGVAIIILTLLIRLLMWPLVKKQLHHTKIMREIQPQIAEIRKKAKGDRQKESLQMMELFKEKEISPFGAMGLALLQLPILIALFFVLRHIIEPAKVAEIAYPFVANLGPVKEILSNPGNFHPHFLGLIDMAKPSLTLALLAGVTQFWQARQLAPQNTTKTTPAARMGFNMTLFLPLLTVYFASRFPSALALYWATSSLVAAIQQQLVLREDVNWARRLLPAKGKNGDTGK